MVLRRAGLGKTLAKLSNRIYTTTLTSVNVITTDNREHSIRFGPGLAVLCGGNGAGKSTTLGALYRCLTADKAHDSLPSVPPWMASIEVSGIHQGMSWSATYDVSSFRFSGSCPAPVYYLDAAASTEDLISKFRGDDNPADLIEGIDPASLSSELVELLSLTLRRQYSEISVYEITSYSEDDAPIPYFAVEFMNRSYKLLNMGRGELSAIYLIWQLSLYEPGSIVLIEEPEAHLATYSQKKLLDVLVYFAAERDLTIIASSHSPGVFGSLPDEHTVLVSISPTPGFKSAISTAELAEYLGLDRQARVALMVVEDQAAAIFLKSIITHLDHELLRNTSIAYARNGASAVRRVVAELEYAMRPPICAVVGILDGDERIAADPESSRVIGFLPGDEAPEVVMRKVVNDWRIKSTKDWIPPLAGGVSALEMELERVDGLDHHDWLTDLGRRYGELDTFMMAIVGLVLEESDLREEAVALLSWIRGLIQV